MKAIHLDSGSQLKKITDDKLVTALFLKTISD